MLSQLQQKRAWEGWLGAEIRAHYFADLSGYYRSYQRMLTWASLVFSSGALATVVGTWLVQVAPWIPAVLAFIGAGLNFYSLVSDNQKIIVDSADLYLRWARLAREYQDLWEHVYDGDAPLRLSRLEDTEEELSKIGTALPNLVERMRKWEHYVLQQHRLPLPATA